MPEETTSTSPNSKRLEDLEQRQLTSAPTDLIRLQQTVGQEDLAKEKGIPPEVLNANLSERIDEMITGRQLRRLERNLLKEGIGCSWERYIDIMNNVQSAKATMQSNDRLTLTLEFEDDQKRQLFNSFVQDIFAGQEGPDKIKYLPTDSPLELKLANFGHEDLAYLGRIGTALFIEQYGYQLLQNVRLVKYHVLSDIDTEDIKQYLSQTLLRRIEEQKEALGEDADNSLLTSGIGISKMGKVVRKALLDRGMPLVMQREPKSRAYPEKEINFPSAQYLTPGAPPVSGTTAGHQVVEIVKNAIGEAGYKDFTTRNYHGMGATAVDVATGGLVMRVGGAAARVTSTMIEGTAAVLWGYIKDKQAERMQTARERKEEFPSRHRGHPPKR